MSRISWGIFVVKKVRISSRKAVSSSVRRELHLGSCSDEVLATLPRSTTPRTGRSVDGPQAAAASFASSASMSEAIFSGAVIEP